MLCFEPTCLPAHPFHLFYLSLSSPSANLSRTHKQTRHRLPMQQSFRLGRRRRRVDIPAPRSGRRNVHQSTLVAYGHDAVVCRAKHTTLSPNDFTSENNKMGCGKGQTLMSSMMRSFLAILTNSALLEYWMRNESSDSEIARRSDTRTWKVRCMLRHELQ